MAARRLSEMDIDEISLVEAGAVRKKFYIKKRRNLMELIEMLKEVLGEDTTLTDEEIAKVKALGDEDSKGIVDALNLFKDYTDAFPPELKDALTALVKSACYGYPVEEAAQVDVLADLLDVEKAKEWLGKGTVTKLKKIIQTLQDMVAEKEGTVKKNITDADKLSPEVLAQLEELQTIKAAALAKAAADKDKVITDLVDTVKTLNDTVTKMAKGEPITKQLPDDPDPNDSKSTTTLLTKAQYEKLSKEERKLAVEEGRYDAWQSIRLVSKQPE